MRKKLKRFRPFSRLKFPKRSPKRLRRWKSLLSTGYSFFAKLINTLWFKIVTAFVLVLLLMVIILSSIITSLTERAFHSYVLDRSAYIQEIVPTLIVPPPIPTNRPVPTIPPIPTPSEGLIPPIESIDAVTIDALTQELELARLELERQQNAIERIVIEGVINQQPLIDDFVTELVPSESELIGQQFIEDIREGVMVAAIASLLASIVVATFLTRQITRPLTQLQKTSQTLASGNLSARVPVRSKDELGNVARTFNQMAQQIEKHEQTRRQMVADVAHELRTPLTVMKSNLEAMQDGLLKPSPQELGELQGEVERLAHMIDDLRLLSLADAGQLQMQMQPVDVNQLVETTRSRYLPFAELKSIELRAHLSPRPLKVSGDLYKLQQALGNLLDNALHHTPTGGLVTVTVSSDATAVHLSVADTGSGIGVDELPYLFDRFWRGDKSRNRGSGGTGLGLSIVKQIVELHGGSIQVANLQNGTLFTLKLPI